MIDLPIDNFIHGYNASHTNCIDVPIAGASSHFRLDNYYYYSALYSLYLNWLPPLDWMSLRRSVLKHLGLSFQVRNAESSDQLIPKIAFELEQGCPVIMLVKYGALFYSKYYGWGDYDHALIVSGHDADKETVTIRDREVIREHIDSGLMKGDALQKLQITEPMLKAIWDKSNEYFECERSPHAQRFYVIGREGEGIEAYDSLLKVASELVDPVESQLAAYVRTYDPISSPEYAQRTSAEVMTRAYVRSLITFFDSIERTAVYAQLPKEERERYERFKKQFFNIRNGVVQRMQIYASKRVRPDEKQRQQLVDSVLASDEELCQWLAVLSEHRRVLVG